jgi:hypothetical protein
MVTAKILTMKINLNKIEKEWDSLDDYPIDDWQREVAEGNTRLGYIDWVLSALESENVLRQITVAADSDSKELIVFDFFLLTEAEHVDLDTELEKAYKAFGIPWSGGVDESLSGIYPHLDKFVEASGAISYIRIRTASREYPKPETDVPAEVEGPDGAEYRTVKTLIEDYVRQVLGQLPYTGGCRTFFSPKEWATRGEEHGLKSKLIVAYDGGDYAPFFRIGEFDRLAESMQRHLNKHGYMYEECTNWYSAVHKLK